MLPACWWDWLLKVAQTAKGSMFLATDDNVVQYFDLEHLAGTNQVTCDFDICLGWIGMTTWMVVLCNAPSYVQLPIVGADITSVFRRDDVLWMRMSHPRPAVLIWEFAR